MAFIRARDIADHFRNKGAEQGALYVCTVLAEQQIALQKDMRGLAEALDQMTGILGSVMTIAGNMKGAIESLNSQAMAEEDMGESTQLIGRNDG